MYCALAWCLVLAVACSLTADVPPSAERLDVGGEGAPLATPSPPPASATGAPFIVTARLAPAPSLLIPAEAPSPTPTPEPPCVALPPDLGAPRLQAAYEALTGRQDVRLAIGARDCTARAVWALLPPEGALLLRQEPYVAATHVLSPTAQTSRIQLLNWASGATPGPTLAMGDDGAALRALLGLEVLGPNALRLENWQAAKEYVATHPGAWALLPWESVDFRVQVASVDGAWPDPRRPWANPLMRRLWLLREEPLPSGVTEALAEALRYRPTPTVELVAVGDVMLARLVGERIALWGTRYPFEGEGIQPLLSGADLAFGNLECAISERGERQDKGYTFRASPAVTDGLTYAGFDVLSLANNHTGDFGHVALTDTLAILEEVGIAAVGAGETITEARRLQVVEANGLRVGFLAYNEIGPSWFAATETRPGSAFMDLEAIRADVAAARREADVVVASCHWGIEYTPYPTAYQREVAQALAEAGADLVLGHHPHVVQGLGYYPETLVAFSLGNFIFDQGLSEQTEEGLILRALLDPGGVKTVQWLRHAVTRSQPALVPPEQALPMLERILRVTREQGLLP